MSATSSRNVYRKRTREPRGATLEPIFGSMTYSDNPLDPGEVHTVVNMIQKDFGKRARPRGGVVPVSPSVDLGTQLSNPYVFSTGVILVTDIYTGIPALRRYSLVIDYPDANRNQATVSTANSKIVIEIPAKRAYGTDTIPENAEIVLSSEIGDSKNIVHDPRLELIKIENMVVERPTPLGVFAELSGNLYVMGSTGLLRVDVQVTGTGDHTHEFKAVELELPSPYKGLSSGYNMLSNAPYLFNNTEGSATVINGVTPYDVANPTHIKMQAHLGDKLLLRVTYTYVAGKSYKVMWQEMQLDAAATPNVLQSAEDSPTYVAGNDITYTYETKYDKFTLIATIYDAADITQPLWEMQIPVYNLIREGTTPITEVQNFDFSTCKDMVEWKNQIVVYGVEHAETGIFISALNDPTYFPFPYNFVDLGERVITCCDYMGELAVITESSMFIVSMTMDGYTKKKVQSGLEVRAQDRGTIFSVRNLVHLRSNGKYYMIVPDLRNDAGNLQIAPITDPIQTLFDNLKVNLYDIINTVYNIGARFQTATGLVDFRLLDYRCIQDSSRLRNVYRISLKDQNDRTLYVDMHVIYDTITRAWYIEVYETTASGMFLFKTLSTGYAEFLSISTQGLSHKMEWVRIDERVVKDSFKLDEGVGRTFMNRQYIDTGKRNMLGALKKRFRSIILEFNNLADDDISFNHQFLLDDQERSDLYVYETKQITDPADSSYGQIYVDRSYNVGTEIAGTTKLNTWTLNKSHLPDISVVRVHLDVSGKGYYPRFKMVATTPKLYDINNITWVWRTKNAR